MMQQNQSEGEKSGGRKRSRTGDVHNQAGDKHILAGDEHNQAGNRWAQGRDKDAGAGNQWKQDSDKDVRNAEMKKLTFSDLKITNMPGLPGSIHLENLSDGIVVVAGPNASGKTTSVRAMNYLLWTEVAEEELKQDGFFTHQLSIHANIKIGGEKWVSGYDFGNRTIRREHHQVEQLPVPPKEHQRRYNLRLSHLLARDDDRTFAGYIHKEALGGFDLDAAAKQLIRKTGKPAAGLGEYKEWQKAVDKIKELTAEDRELKRSQQKLEELEKEKENLETQAQKLRLYENLISFKDIEQELRNVVEQLKTFPDAHETYHRQILEAVDETDKQIQKGNDEIPELEQTISDLHDGINDLGLPDQGVPEERIQRLQEILRSIQLTGQQLDQHGREISGADKEREQISAQIKGNLHEAAAETGFDSDTVARTAGLVEKESKALHEKQQAESEIRSLGELPASHSTAEEVKRGIDLLSEWLRMVGGRQLSGMAPAKAGLMLLLALIAGGGMLVTPWLGLIAIIPLVWWFVEWNRTRSPSESGEMSRITQRYGETDLKPPEKWEIDEVKERLLTFVDEYQQLREAERKEDRRNKLEAQIKEAEKQLGEIDTEKAELLKQTGFRPDEIGLPELHYQLHHMVRYNDQCSAIVRLKEEQQTLEKQYSGQKKEFLELMSDYLKTEDETEAGMQEELDRLRQLAGRGERLQQDLKNAISQKKRAVKQLKEKQDQLAEHYSRIGMEPGDYPSLLKLDEWHGMYMDLKQRQSNLEQQKNGMLADIKAHPHYEASVLELDGEEAAREKTKCEDAEQLVKELRDEITSINTQIADRTRRQDLGQALKMQETALEKLESRFDEYVEDRFLDRIIAFLKAENQKRNYPEVFHRASELFGRFTENRYELEIDQPDIMQSAGRLSSDDHQQFVAVDHANNGELYPLDRLSEGTRIQLLLAVRMAFVEQLEDGIKLPFFADELLAVSDDARAGAIMDALIAISREGRQVFYFTAQGDEVEKWRQKSAGTGAEELVQIQTIGRDELYRGDGPVTTPALQLGYGRNVPDPGGQTHEEYGQALKVPAFNPKRMKPDRLHPWYLTEDTNLIADCLRNGLMTWRQVCRFLEAKGKLRSRESNGTDKLLEAGSFVEQVIDLWRIGRAAPIDGSVLRQSGAISEKFLPEADALLKSVDSDPVRFLDEVESGAIKGFRQNKKNELREYFEREGFLPAEEPLSGEEMQIRIQALISDLNYLGRDEAMRVLSRVYPETRWT